MWQSGKNSILVNNEFVRHHVSLNLIKNLNEQINVKNARILYFEYDLEISSE